MEVRPCGKCEAPTPVGHVQWQISFCLAKSSKILHVTEIFPVPPPACKNTNFLIFRTEVSCFSITLFYSTLIVLTHRQKDRQRLKYTRCAWAGGTFFPVVLLCQFLVVAGNRFWFYLPCTYVLGVQYSCGVVLVFWFWREIVFSFTYVLSVQYIWAVVSFFLLWREIVL